MYTDPDDYMKCRITVAGFGAKGAASIAILRTRLHPEIQFEVIDASLAPQEIVPRFVDTEILILLIDNLSRAETGIALEIANMGADAPYWLVAITPDMTDADYFRTALGVNAVANVNAIISMQSATDMKAECNAGEDEQSILDDRLCNTIYGITVKMLKKGMVCVDLSDLKCVLHGPGFVHVGIGCCDMGIADNRLVLQALNDMPNGVSKAQHARGVLAIIQAGENFRLEQFSSIGDALETYLTDECTVVVGVVEDETMGDKIRLYLYALS